LEADVELRVIGGPECARGGGNYKWWQIRTPDGTEGWVAEGDAFQTNDLYFILPEALQGVEAGRTPYDLGCPASPRTILQLGDVVEVDDNFGDALRLRAMPAGDV